MIMKEVGLVATAALLWLGEAWAPFRRRGIFLAPGAGAVPARGRRGLRVMGDGTSLGGGEVAVPSTLASSSEEVDEDDGLALLSREELEAYARRLRAENSALRRPLTERRTKMDRCAIFFCLKQKTRGRFLKAGL